jgi:hypothetical protein
MPTLLIVQATQGVQNNFDAAQKNRGLRQHRQDSFKVQYKEKATYLSAETTVNITEKEHGNGTLAANKDSQLVSEDTKEALSNAVTQTLSSWNNRDAKNNVDGPKI